MLVVTLGLGTWQLQRLAWKRALLAEIATGESAAPLPLGPSPSAFRRVLVSGRFLPATARYGIELRSLPGLGPTLGAHVLNPLLPDSGPPLLVDRGWAPLDNDSPPPLGQQTLEAYVRPPEPATWSGPRDDPAQRRFYALDPAAIGPALGLATIAPFTLVALGAPTGLPQPATALPRPPNDHLSYALTWFGLAAALLVIFAIYARQSLTQPRPRPS